MDDKRRLNRRDFLRLSVAAAAGAVLAACRPAVTPVPVEVAPTATSKPVEAAPTPAPKPAEKAKLVFQDWAGWGMPEAWESMAPAFAEKYPNIEVTYNPYPDQWVDKLIASMVAGTCVDIFSPYCEILVKVVEMGQVLDVTAYAEKDLTKDDWNDWVKAQIEEFKSDGRLMSLPKYLGTMAIYWNKDMFDEEKVEHPPREWKNAWDHDAYRKAMLKFVKRDAAGKLIRFGSWVGSWWDRVQLHLNDFGGYYVDPQDDTRCVLGDPPAQEALEWLRARHWDDNCYPQSLLVEKQEGGIIFSAARTAMMEEGSWWLKGAAEKLLAKWSVAPLAKGPAAHVTLATTDAYTIWKGTKYPDAAWELLKFLAGPDYGKAIAEHGFLQPSRMSNLDYWYKVMRKVNPVLEGVDVEVFGEAMEQGLGVVMELFKKQAEAMELITPAMEQLLDLGKAKPEIFKEVCEKVTAGQRAA